MYKILFSKIKNGDVTPSKIFACVHRNLAHVHRQIWYTYYKYNNHVKLKNSGSKLTNKIN